MMGTQITREVDATLYTRCGIEISVAASKTFTAQVALLSLLSLRLAEIRQTLPQEEIDFVLDRLHELPDQMKRFLDGDHPVEAPGIVGQLLDARDAQPRETATAAVGDGVGRQVHAVDRGEAAQLLREHAAAAADVEEGGRALRQPGAEPLVEDRPRAD